MRTKRLCLYMLPAALAAAIALTSSATASETACAASDNLITILAEQKTTQGECSVADVPKIGSPRGEISKINNFNGEIHTLIENKTTSPQHVKVRFLELEHPQYDVYIDGKLSGQRIREELETGIPLEIPTGVAVDEIPLLEEMRTLCLAMMKDFDTTADSDSAIIGKCLTEMNMSCMAALTQISYSRSCPIILVPEGKAMQRAPIYLRQPARKIQSDMQLRWKDFYQRRRFIQEKVKNPVLRNRALAALTPVQLTATRSELEDGGFTVRCSLTNLTRPAVTGQIQLVVPNGWTAPDPIGFQATAAGARVEAAFKVSAPAGAAQPYGLRVSASVRAEDAAFSVQQPVPDSPVGQSND